MSQNSCPKKKPSKFIWKDRLRNYINVLNKAHRHRVRAKYQPSKKCLMVNVRTKNEIGLKAGDLNFSTLFFI